MSLGPGSVAATEMVALPPSLVGPELVTEMIVGSRLITATVKTLAANVPSLSVALALMV